MGAIKTWGSGEPPRALAPATASAWRNAHALVMFFEANQKMGGIKQSNFEQLLCLFVPTRLF